MSSEFGQYFEEFLGDDANEFDIFKNDFSSEPLHQEYLQLQDRAVNSFDTTPSEDLQASLTSTTTNSAPSREMLMPETEFRTGVGVNTPSPVNSLNDSSLNIASPSLCPWISCSTRSAIRTENETTAHLEAHWRETLEQWFGPRGCDWPGCSSRATFKSPGSLRTHIFNIHISPLVCTYPQCTYTNPFGKQGNLRRHIATIHEATSNHICPMESCEANIKGFARKDKPLNHIKEQHDNLRCPYNHCYATVLETEQHKHLQQFHGSFECALGACEKGPASCFSEVCLRRHFRRDHNITVDPARTLIRRVRMTKDNTARSSHIVQLKKWKDCPPCSEAQSALRFVQDNEGFQIQNGNWAS